MIDSGKIYTTKEVGKLFRVSDIQVRRMCLNGDLRAFKIGTDNYSWRIEGSALLEYIERNTNRKESNE